MTFYNPKKKPGFFFIGLIRILFPVLIIFSLISFRHSIGKILAAGDVSTVWDFETPSNFTLSDPALIEVSGGSARLKVRNYDDDATTQLLLHLDEASGNPTDSSGNTTVTANSISYTTGKLNNAAVFDGSVSYLSAQNFTGLNPTQNMTLESWIKFDRNFSSTSHFRKQPLLDKGSYKLYWDNQNGKLTYELTPNTTPTWSQVAGGNEIYDSWDMAGKLSVTSQEAIGDDIYVGTGNTIGDAYVYKWNGTVWTRIGGAGLNSSWVGNTFEEVNSMASMGTNLYVGLGNDTGEAEVWRYNGTTWSRIAGSAVLGAGYDRVLALEGYKNELYVGLGVSTDEGRVWKCSSCDGTPAWTQVAGAGAAAGYTSWSATDDIDAVYTLVSDATYLYAGLGASTDDADVWRFDGNTWTQIGGINTSGETINSGWTNANDVEAVLTMALNSDYLYAGVGLSADDAKVWRLDWDAQSLDWEQIGGPGTGGWDATMDIEGVYSLALSGSTLYAGLGNSNDDADIWMYDGSWTQIGGTSGTSTVNNSWTDGVNSREVETLMVHDSNLYTGLYNASDGGEEWFWNGSAWSQIGGNYLNNSWGFYGLDRVSSMTTCNDKLYAGTGSSAGEANVWEYDESTWVRIGGQNTGWTADTYEIISSLVCYKNSLYVGLGSGTDDGLVWKYSGDTWTQVGGKGADAGYASWADADNIDYVLSLATDEDYLYAGLGASQDDADVWRFDGNTWTQIGGMTSGGTTINSGWGNADNIEGVYSLIYDSGYLYAGLGNSTDDADIWRLDVDAQTLDWEQIAGVGSDAGFTSWGNADDKEYVYSLAIYEGNVFAGLGGSTGDADVWEFDGTWELVGGGASAANSSWEAVTYEYILSMSVYNGKLFAGLGNTSNTTDGEVWTYDGTDWSIVGGDGNNSSWSTQIEEIDSLETYHGKLYAGLGVSANADVTIWSYGGNTILRSDAVGIDDDWHHIAATYDGSNMKLYIDGELDNTKSTALQISAETNPLYIGTSHGIGCASQMRGFFEGKLDETRVSSVARDDFTTEPYATAAQTVRPNSAVMIQDVKNWEEFITDETSDGGSVRYRLSVDGGASWKYWNDNAWSASSGINQVNTAADINSHISALTAGSGGIIWQAVLTGNGQQQVKVNNLEIKATSDTTNPQSNADNLQMYKSDGGTEVNPESWTNSQTPFFSWSPGADNENGAGLKGYCLYLGQSGTANPGSSKGILGNSPITTVGSDCQFIVSGTEVDLSTDGYIATAAASSLLPYYFSVKAIDKAGNVYGGESEQFKFYFDNTEPTNVALIYTPTGSFSNVVDMSFSWPISGISAADDEHSQVLGFQYQISSTSGTWKGTQTHPYMDFSYIPATVSARTLTQAQDGGSIVSGDNVIYFRTIDNAGNFSTGNVTGNLQYGGAAPSFGSGSTVTVTPQSSTTNSFSLSWPAATPANGQNISSYYYMVNTLPPSTLDTLQGNSGTYFDNGTELTLATGSLPNVNKGTNKVYIVAIDDADTPNYSPSNYITGSFTLNSTNPDNVNNLLASDSSIKSQSLWNVTLTWTAPTYKGAGNLTYLVYRSSDGVSYSQAGSTSGLSYVDNTPASAAYYYKIYSKDGANAQSSGTNAVTITPTGKWSSAPELDTDPVAGSITTKKAIITWSTDRSADSKVQYGTSSGSYGSVEPSSSSQVSSHSINLTGLEPGTKYYYKAKWTDEDGNTGTSEEKTFTTAGAPTVKDVAAKSISLSSVILEFTSKDAAKVRIYYGPTSAFGGIKEISTSVNETTYTAELTGLLDGTKYYYKINTYDSELAEYEGTILDFTTLPKPKISNVRIQQVTGTAQSTVLITWNTNTEVSSIVTYYPVGKPQDVKDDINVALTSGAHRIIIRGLLPDTPYMLVVKGRDKVGNEAVSDSQKLTTATDTRPPQVSELQIEGSHVNAKNENTQDSAQLVVTWNTDEPATSQVEFGEGTGTTYAQKTQEDNNLTINHITIISGLSTSKVYHLRVLSKDKAGNAGNSVDTVTITPKSMDNAFNLVITNLQSAFGFLGNIK